MGFIVTSRFQFTKLKILSFLVIASSCILMVVSCTEKRLESQVEDLLRVSLPDDATDIQYEKVFESSEFTKPYFAYLQVRLSEEDYLVLVEELELSLQANKNDPIFVYDRLQPNRFSPDWWNPPATNEDPMYAGGEFVAAANHGWIVSIYSNGSAYLKAYEEGMP